MNKILSFLFGLLFITHISVQANAPILLKKQALIDRQLSAWKAHFPHLKMEDFKLDQTDTILHQKSGMTDWNKYLKDYEEFFYYAPDKQTFIDLFSVGRSVEKVNDRYYARFEPYQAVLLGTLTKNKKELYPITICGRYCSFEEVLWINDNELFIVGNDINEANEEEVKPMILYINIKNRKLEKYINTHPQCFNTVIYQGPKYELINYDQGQKSFPKNKTSTITEQFVDSTHIGKTGQLKLMLRQETFDDNNAVVHYTLYKKHQRKWTVLQKDSVHKTADLPMLPQFEDFNNDGYTDVSIKYEASGNGANDIRLVLLFNSAQERLQLIKNATAYPNLAYNKKTNSMTALSVYGNNSNTTFFDLKNNELIEIALVHFDGKTIESFSIKNDIQTLIEKKPYQDAPTPYIRFTHFDPIEE